MGVRQTGSGSGTTGTLGGYQDGRRVGGILGKLGRYFDTKGERGGEENGGRVRRLNGD